jgi:hypothetical protein
LRSGLRDAEALEGLLHVVGDFLPGADGLLAFGEVVADVLELDVVEVRVAQCVGIGISWKILSDFWRNSRIHSASPLTLAM